MKKAVVSIAVCLVIGIGAAIAVAAHATGDRHPTATPPTLETPAASLVGATNVEPMSCSDAIPTCCAAFCACKKIKFEGTCNTEFSACVKANDCITWPHTACTGEYRCR